MSDLLRSVFAAVGEVSSVPGVRESIESVNGLVLWTEVEGKLEVVKGPCVGRIVDMGDEGPHLELSVSRAGDFSVTRRIPVVSLMGVAPLDLRHFGEYTVQIRTARASRVVH